MKRTLSIILTICLMMSMLPTSIFSIAASAVTFGNYTYTITNREATITSYNANAAGSVIIPANLGGYPVTSIGYKAFYNRSSITMIMIPNTITSIEENAFLMPNGSDATGVYISDLSAWCKIYFSNYGSNPLYAAENLYLNLTKVKKLEIPDEITNINPYAFYYCKSLTEVALPDSVTSIGDDAFGFCTNIIHVWYEGSEAEKNSILFGQNNTCLSSAIWHYNACMENSIDYTHSFDNCETILCSNCNEYFRDVAPGHIYDDCNDTSCNGCDYVRIAPGHTYDDCYDLACNVCEFVRSSEHEYQNGCDTTCDVCSYTRAPFEHIYSNEWDTTCDECGETRIAGPFTITYHLDGGTNALKNPDVYTSDDTIVLKDASKVGYDFAGWFLDADKTQQVTTIPLQGNIDVYAKFTPKSYIAIFDDNEATSSSVLTVTLDDSNGAIKTKELNNDDRFNPYAFWRPKRDGYVFAGWYYNSTLVDDSEMVIKSNITLYAKWKNIKVADDVQAIVLGEDIKEIFTSGSSFYGKDSNGSTKYFGCSESFYDYDKDYNGYSNYVLYIYVDALYDTIYYKGSVKGQYATYGSSGWVDYGRCSISGDGIQGFSKYYSQTQYGEETFSGSIHVSPGTLLMVQIGNYQWNTSGRYLGQITITLGSANHSSIKASHERIVEQEYDSIIYSPNVSNKGYDFNGWYDVNGNKMTDIWQYTQDQTFTAKWQPIKYNIMYSLDGGTNSLSNPSSYTIEDSITLNDPYKAGYTFMGWYFNSDFKTKVTNISKQTGNVTLYAKWEVNSYNLTLDANMGTFAPNVTFISDGVEIKKCYLYEQDTLTAYRPENKNGYIFVGWYKDASFTELFTFNGTITEDTTLYAKWIKCSDNVINIENTNSFDVSINGKTEQLYAFVPLVDGKIVVTSLSDGLDLYGILYDNSKNELISSDDIDSERDLDFSYTYNIKAGQLYYIAVMGKTASTRGEATINIDWTGSCTITGTTYPNRQISVVYDTEYKLPPKPIREGFIFMGWFDENGVQVTDGIWNFTTDKTLTARWDSVENHNHSYGAWSKYDGDQHVRDCMCGEKEYSDHTFGVCEKYDNNQHVSECVCGEKQYAAHVWDNGVVTTQPTYADEGIMTYTCTDCGATKTSSISSLAPTDMEFSLNDAGTEYSVTAYTGKETEIAIPSTYNGLPVTSISDGAFLKSRGLVRIKIPASVKDICVDAFNVCYRLSSIEVNENNPYYKSIDGNLYSKDGKTLIRYACGKSQNIFAMPESVTVVKDNAFYDAYSLETIVFSDNVTAIGLGTMPSTPNLRYIYIGRSVADIAEGAFSNCYGLEEISVDKDNAYYQSIDGKLYSKDGKTLVAFADKAGYGAYSFIVPDGVTRISAKAFCSNYGITDITIPESMTSIGDYAFSFCTDLTSITFKGTFEQWNAITFASTWDEATGDYKVYCTDGVMCKTHTWDSGVITAQPTCMKEGVKTFTCSTCKATKTDVIAKIVPDVDKDGDVDEADAELLLKHITCWDVEINEAVADVNGDGEVNIRDAATILLYLSGKNVELT